MSLRLIAFEQAKFEYSPLGKIFNTGLDKGDGKKEGLKRLQDIEGKNEELLNTFSQANKGSKAPQNESNYITLITLFTNFTETLKSLKECL